MTLPYMVYKVLKRLARMAGYAFTIRRLPQPGTPYEPVFPNATYAPWLSDGAFRKAYEIVQRHTLVDMYRCFELWELVGETVNLDGALIEVGVWRGGSGALIALRNKLDGRAESVYLCDTFTGVVKTSVYDPTYREGEHDDTTKGTVQDLLRQLGLETTKILVGIYPDETGAMVSESSFRFCHIDVDVYQSAKDVLKTIWPKMVVGGIVVFDDYGFQRCAGITRLVNEERHKKDRLVIHNLNGHALFVKIKE